MRDIGLFKWIGIIGIVTIIGNPYAYSQEVENDAAELEEVDIPPNDAEVVEEAEEADTTAEATEAAEPVVGDVSLGRAYFEGSKRFKKGGPACITCHNVSNDELIPGGLLAVDLTDIYPKYGAALSMWLENPDNAPMTTSYTKHAMTDMERASLAAFLEHANEVKDSQAKNSGYSYMLLGGGIGLVIILLLISVLWMKRKKQMVKKDIFARQNRAWDAKH